MNIMIPDATKNIFIVIIFAYHIIHRRSVIFMISKKVFALIMLFVMMFAVGAEANIISNKTMKKIKKIGKAGEKFYEKHEEDIKKAGEKAVELYQDRNKQNNVQQQPQQQPQTRQRTVIVHQQADDRLTKSSTTNYPAGELESNLKAFARNFIVNNGADFEIQLTANEAPKNAGTRLNKVSAKNRTIVGGDSGSNRNYRPFCFMTANENYTFSGGIRVGASIRTVENFFVQRARDIATRPGTLHFETNSKTYIDILYDTNSGTITQIGYYDTNGTNCGRTRSFMRQKAGEFGFATMY